MLRTLAILCAVGCGSRASSGVDAGDASRQVDAMVDGAVSLRCGLNDTASHAPPTAGPFAYATFVPGSTGFPAPGEAYTDPVFGCAVRRLTNVLPGWGSSLIYSKNGFWNADGTRYANSPNAMGEVDVIDGDTGAVIRANVPFGAEGSFDPVDPDAFYAFAYQSNQLRRYAVSTGTDTVIKTLPAQLDGVGGSVDWIDRSGRYFL